MEQKKELIDYLNNLSYFLLGILFLVFPVFFLSFTTDAFTLPKQALLGGVSLLLLIIYGIKTIAEKRVLVRRTPFDLPVLIFTIVVFLSAIFSVNRIDSLINFVPLLFAVVAYFMITNNLKDKKSASFLTIMLVLGAVVSALISILSMFKIYVFPDEFSRTATFTTVGTLLDQAIYVALVLPLAAHFVTKDQGVKSLTRKKIGFSLASLIILIGLIISIYNLIAQQRPTLLPFETGFQTAFAAVSQDTGRIIQGFLLGSGYGNYGIVFSKFKQAAFNLNPDLWSFIFYRSSSFVLELLATTGILGLISFLFLCYKIVKERPLSFSLVLAIILSFVLPFSFVTLSIFFIVLALYASTQGIRKTNDDKYFDVELELVALKKGLISFEEVEGHPRKSKSLILPVVFAVILFLIAGYIGYMSTRYVVSNVYFQKSILAANQNNGTLTYQNQTDALNMFRYSDNYYRVFSQTNMALANSLAASVPEGSSPSAEVSQTIYTLIQQSINTGRTATTLSPQTALNWQNLSSIYRSLIGFGQNADQFAVLANQQAILLDPNNPQEYINLGGIYYQLGLFDQAQQQFQIAVSLKPDYANAYYNLGHALENQGKLTEALAQYQNVRTLLANDQANLDVINKEIEALNQRIQTGQVQQPAEEQAQAPTEELNVPQPTTILPTQNPPVKIPGISETPTPTPTTEPTTSTSPEVQP